MLRRIDESAVLSRLLSWVSTTLAVNRGLPMLAGTAMVVFSFILSGVFLFVITGADDVPDVWLLLCIPATLLHLGVIIGFIGFMMSAPLGSGYRE